MKASCGCRDPCRSPILSTLRKASSNCVDIDGVESPNVSLKPAVFVACSAIDFSVITCETAAISLVFTKTSRNNKQTSFELGPLTNEKRFVDVFASAALVAADDESRLFDIASDVVPAPGVPDETEDGADDTVDTGDAVLNGC